MRPEEEIHPRKTGTGLCAKVNQGLYFQPADGSGLYVQFPNVVFINLLQRGIN